MIRHHDILIALPIASGDVPLRMRNPLNNIAMTRYKNLSGDSGVTAYAVTPDSIIVEFRDGPVYLYNHCIAGMRKVEAAKGRGLATYINKYVKKLYTAKLR